MEEGERGRARGGEGIESKREREKKGEGKREEKREKAEEKDRRVGWGGRETTEEMRGEEKRVKGLEGVREREIHYMGISENK